MQPIEALIAVRAFIPLGVRSTWTACRLQMMSWPSMRSPQSGKGTCVAKPGVTGDASSASDGNVTLDRTERPTDVALAGGPAAAGPKLASDALTDAALTAAATTVAISPV